MATIDFPSHDYPGQLAVMRARFAAASAAPALFTTDADPDALWAAYLDALPAERQHYTCSACRHFIKRYGGLVVISGDGSTDSALWDEGGAPPFFAAAVAALRRLAARARVTGVLVSGDRVLGTTMAGGWEHFSFALPRHLIHASRAQTPFQAAAEKAEDYKTIQGALQKYTPEMVEQAVRLLQSEQLYRSERVLGPAQWLQGLHATRAAAASSRQRDNLTWLAVATAPAGFCHPSSSMVGTLLDDIAAGLPFEAVKTRFAAKMSPTTYQRAQAAPAAGAIAQAEKLFAQMGLAPALPRRYARLGELPKAALVWSPAPEKSPAAAPAQGGVFGHLQAKQTPPTVAAITTPPTTMTWEKFQRTVLPMARRIEALVPSSASRFAALITAADADAPPILQWDREDSRNPYSWYYADGIDAEMRRRLTRAGGRYQNVELRASLMWNNENDLDIHVITPRGDHIYYGNKTACRFGGYLDVDMNVLGETREPVENVRWESAPEGRYRVYVNCYATHRGNSARTPFTAEIAVGQQVYTFTGVTRTSNSYNGFGSMELLADFTYQGGVATGLASEPRAAAPGAPNDWGLIPGAFAPVTAVVRSPNLWGATLVEHVGRHAFFLLAGCRDSQEGIGRGFFTETLRSELHPVRSVLEAYAASATIAGADRADACGIGISAATTGGLTLRVDGGGLYTLDRWD